MESTGFINKISMPADYYLYQNYPNPFNPNTVISYKLQNAGNVTLKVCDLLGRETATLVDEYKQPGVYNSQFSILNTQLPAGVYFYTLKSGNFSITKKMFLVNSIMSFTKNISPVANPVYRTIPVMLFLFCLLTFYIPVEAQTDTSSVIWYLDQLENIGGLPTTKLSNPSNGPTSEYPLLVDSPFGKAAYFDGINDGILVLGNPLGSSSSFTMEILFKPEAGHKNDEKRFIHIRNKNSDSRRILFELTPLLNNQWTFKTFILSEKNSLDVIDSLHYRHEFNQWYHAALVYENGTMHNYINQVHESFGNVTYIPIENGQISIGARQDPRSWLKGTIRFIKFTKRALTPLEFTGIPTTNMELEKTLPVTGQLYQNYPNPFNPVTKIKFALPQTSITKLTIYDLLGREVNTLINQELSAGYHEVELNAGNIPSGIYFYRIDAGRFVSVKKCIIK